MAIYLLLVSPPVQSEEIGKSSSHLLCRSRVCWSRSHLGGFRVLSDGFPGVFFESYYRWDKICMLQTNINLWAERLMQVFWALSSSARYRRRPERHCYFLHSDVSEIFESFSGFYRVLHAVHTLFHSEHREQVELKALSGYSSGGVAEQKDWAINFFFFSYRIPFRCSECGLSA